MKCIDYDFVRVLNQAGTKIEFMLVLMMWFLYMWLKKLYKNVLEWCYVHNCVVIEP
jgi:hypothetical protein